MKKLALATLMAATAFTAQAASLLDGDYVVERVVNEGRVSKPADDKLALRIEGDRIAGFAGCNRFTGPVKYQDGKIVLGPLAATMMACPDPAGNRVEGDLLQALGAVSRYGLDQANGSVVLRGGKGELVTLKRVNQ
ncbi:META domain-containing protein [Chitinibacteraceae bacterium HSL-7]